MIVAAMGASLVAMVARINLENDAFAVHQPRLRRIIATSDSLRSECESARQRDETAYRRVVAASALPKATQEEKASRASVLQDALIGAAEAPLHGAHLAVRVLHLAADALVARNKNLVSDIGCAAEFGASAVSACAYNVRINHRFIKDRDIVARQANRLAREERECAGLLQAVRREVNRELR